MNILSKLMFKLTQEVGLGSHHQQVDVPHLWERVESTAQQRESLGGGCASKQVLWTVPWLVSGTLWSSCIRTRGRYDLHCKRLLPQEHTRVLSMLGTNVTWHTCGHVLLMCDLKLSSIPTYSAMTHAHFIQTSAA